MDLENSTTLGRATHYPEQYDPSQLVPIPRQSSREKLPVPANGGSHECTGGLPFQGEDLWNAYELSWLGPKGKPEVAIGEFRLTANSPYLIESKSFKLYLNSFNQTVFKDWDEVAAALQKDLTAAAGGEVEVRLFPVDGDIIEELQAPSLWENARCLDELDILFTDYQPNPDTLAVVADTDTDERLCSHLLKSNCPVTGQPDWGSVYIHYRGCKIDDAGLLRYIVSLRGHQDFHEHCVETIFMEIWNRCRPKDLAVYARYTRRGGLDINPVRSSYLLKTENMRTMRQ